MAYCVRKNKKLRRKRTVLGRTAYLLKDER